MERVGWFVIGHSRLKECIGCLKSRANATGRLATISLEEVEIEKLLKWVNCGTAYSPPTRKHFHMCLILGGWNVEVEINT